MVMQQQRGVFCYTGFHSEKTVIRCCDFTNKECRLSVPRLNCPERRCMCPSVSDRGLTQSVTTSVAPVCACCLTDWKPVGEEGWQGFTIWESTDDDARLIYCFAFKQAITCRLQGTTLSEGSLAESPFSQKGRWLGGFPVKYPHGHPSWTQDGSLFL